MTNNISYRNGDVLVTYNQSSVCDVAKKISKQFDIPWIAIVADLNYPVGADGYVYLNYDYYYSKKKSQKNIHIDGGVHDFKFKPISKNLDKNKNFIFMYSGQLDGHGGAKFLVRSFKLINKENIELWLCGKGINNYITMEAANDKRIKVLGYVTQEKLIDLCNKADFFVNPRLKEGNHTNFPSKILFYLPFKKPIITTENGLSSKYKEICRIITREKTQNLADEMKACISLSKEELKLISLNIESFNKNNTWNSQASNLIKWLNNKIL